MFNKLFLFILFLYIIIPAFCSNESVYIKSYTTDNGLSNGWVRCIYQDDFDFMWFGTSDGLNRFDGISFKNYRPILPDGSEQGNFTVNAILKRDDLSLWICTDYGLYIYDFLNDEFQLFSIVEEHFPILTGAYDHEHNLWLGSDRGVFKINKNQELVNSYTYDVTNEKSISNNYINRIFVDKKNRLWFGTKNGLDLYWHENDNFTRIQDVKNATNYGGNDVLAIKEDGYGRLWIGTALNGTNLLVEKEDNFTLQHILDGVAVDLLIDKDNYVWLGSTEGVSRINANYSKFDSLEVKKFRYNLNDNKSISENTIVCIFEDKNSDIWIGTFGKGVNFYSQRDKKFSIGEDIYGSEQSISNNMVNDFFEDENYLWIATEGGLDRYNKKSGKLIHYLHNASDRFSLASNGIFDLFKDKRGNFWVGTWAGGLHCYDYKNDRFRRYLPTGNQGDLSNANVFSVVEDQRGNLCVATNGGGLNFFNYETEKFRAFKFQKGDTCSIKQNNMDLVFVTSSGKLLLSLYSLVQEFNYETECFNVVQYHPNKEEDDYHGNNIDIFEDSRKNLWFGTERGLILLETQTNESTLYTVANGLPNNTIQSIEEDANGSLWLGTSKGLSKFVNAVSKPEIPEFINFSVLDGLPANDFKRRSSYKNEDGFLYFGTSNGLIKFHPDKIQFNNSIPKVAITQLELNDLQTLEKNKLPPVINSINFYEKIKLRYGYADFTIHYSALNFLHPEGNKYKYKLEGYDKKWIFTSNRNSATYTNIKPGKYTFLVYGTNNDGVWSESPAKLEIEILSPWWFTIWFKLIVLSLIVGIIFLLFRLRLSLLNKRNHLLQEKVEERTIELRALNKQLSYQKNELSIHKNQLEELVEERTKELVKAKNEAEESNRLKSAFLAVMSHELRTPLNAIIGFSSFIDNTLEKNNIIEKVKIINSSGIHLLNIIESVFNLALLQSGTSKVIISEIPVNEFLLELKPYFKAKLSKDENKCLDISIKENIPNQKCVINTDKTKLTQMLINFFDNAAKYTDKGIIEYGYQLRGESIVFYVKDTGIGIPENKIKIIFEKFTQVEDTLTRQHGGVGLGLSICKEISDLLNGEITVESELGQGSVFYFKLNNVVVE